MAHPCENADPLTEKRHLVENVIFVDVDGVLNVGMKDSPHPPLNFSEQNVDKAFRMAQENAYARDPNDVSERIVSVYWHRQQADPEGTRYSEMIAEDTSGVSEVLVKRLADIIHKSGPHRLVVLSSTWRLPRYQSKVKRLERRLSRALGTPFCFDDRTRICPSKEADTGALERLDSIGSYIESNSAQWHRHARVVVLEDFHASQLSTLSTPDEDIQNERDVEVHLERRASQTHDSLSVMLAHTFEHLVTPFGIHIDVGCGITLKQMRGIMDFIDAGRAARDAELQKYYQDNVSKAVIWAQACETCGNPFWSRLDRFCTSCGANRRRLQDFDFRSNQCLHNWGYVWW